MATGRIGTTPVLTTRWSKQPAGGTTVLSGLDDNSVSLVYSVGYEQVYRNGTLLSRGNDYTATNGTTITLVDATIAGDVIEVFANAVVPLTDTYSQTVANSLFVNQSTFDAKGDLIAGTGDNAYSKLTVGSNGDTLVADSSTSTGLRYNPQSVLNNPFINAGMDIAQRGTSISGTSAILYTLDRWCAVSDSSGTSWTATQELTNDTTNLPTIRYAARLKRTNTGTAAIYLSQSVETNNSRAFAGKTVTLSFWARKGADYSGSSSNLTATLGSGTGTDQNGLSGFTGGTTVIGQSATLTTTWQRFAFTGTVGATANELVATFYYTPTGSTFTNDYFEITGVQLDVGTYTASTAPQFRRAAGTLAGELLACKRYYQKILENGGALTTSAYYNSSYVFCSYKFEVEMRTAPTLSIATGTNYYYNAANNALDYLNSLTISNTKTYSCGFYNNTEAAGTAGHAGVLGSDNANGSMALSAEL